MLSESPTPRPAHSRLNPTGRVCRAGGAPEEEEGKSSGSLRRVGNKKVERECGSELVKAEMGRERKETGIFLKGGRREAKREKGKE